MPHHVNLYQAREDLMKVAARQGFDHRTEQCINFDGDKPCCIIGHLYHHWGLTGESAHQLDVDGGPVTVAALDRLRNVNLIVVPSSHLEGVCEYLRSVQTMQDTHDKQTMSESPGDVIIRHTWAEALTAGDKCLRDMLHVAPDHALGPVLARLEE